MNRIRKEIKFSEKEWETVCRRAAAIEMRTGTFIRKISVFGEIKNYNVKDANNVRIAINRIGVNISQIAKVVNSSGSAYQQDMIDLQEQMKQLKIVVENWLEPLEEETQ